MNEKSSFFAELKRRHVYRVAAAYAVVGWMLIEISAIVVPALHLPNLLTTVIVVLVALGFPIAVILAWAFEVTPEGVRRTESAEAEEARTATQGRHVGRRIDFVIIAVLVAAVGMLVWRLSLKPKPTAAAKIVATSAASSAKAAVAATKIPAKSIAVLPFENLSTDQGNKYFADGMQDLILTKLADIGDLKVISRTSTMQYGSHPQNLKEIGRELGVATLLEGSVQKAGNQVLINVQLIDARTDSHIWAQSYTRTLSNVFGVEGEVAEKIAAALKAKLSPAETKRLATSLSNDPAANDLYLRGEFFANQGLTNVDPSAWWQAISLYRKAIEKAPDFAEAHAQLSITESNLLWFGGGGRKAASLIDDALRQAKQALKLAPELADAHLALGYYYYYEKAEFATALKAFSDALALRPNDSAALEAKGLVLRRLGRYEEAIATMKRAAILDPHNSQLAFTLGRTYAMLYRFNDAIQSLQHALALDPNNAQERSNLAHMLLLQTGDLTRALAAAQGGENGLKVQQATLLTYSRKYSQALGVLLSVPDTPKNFIIFNYGGHKDLRLANLYRLSGDPVKAHKYYTKALSEARAQFATLAGSVNQPFTLNFIAQAELGLGQKAAALATIAKLEQIARHSRDHVFGPTLTAYAAILYAQAGHADKAVTLIVRALDRPGTGVVYSPVMLWLDPVWDPIRKTPAFQALLKKYAKYKPATVPAVGSAPTASTVPSS